MASSRVSTRWSRRIGIGIAMGVALGFPGVPAAQVFDPDLIAVDGVVRDIDKAGGRVYVAGEFSCVAPFSGSGVPITKSTGVVVEPFPEVAGQIRAVVPDGAGGWYIGGQFGSVGGLPRQNLAHIESDLAVSDWNPGANGIIWDLATDGTVVYAAGEFSFIGGAVHQKLAAISTATGLATAWAPTVSPPTSYPLMFTQVETNGSTVYAAGVGEGWNAVGNLVAAFDASSPGVSPALWTVPFTGYGIWTMGITASTVYVGGDLWSLNGLGRYSLGAIDAGTGAVSSWRPILGINIANPDVATIRTIRLRATSVVVGGTFDYTLHPITFDPIARNGLAEFDLAAAVPTAWNPGVQGVISLDEVEGVLYMGGGFTAVSGQPRRHLAAFDSTTGLLAAWNPFDPGQAGGVEVVSASGSNVYVGGSFRSIEACQPRRGFASLDAVTGALTSWNPSGNGVGRAVQVQGSTVYVAGGFTNIGGANRFHLAALDAMTGLATGWNPSVSGFPNELAVSSTTVYVGSAFGTPQAYDISSGANTGWNPNPTPGSAKLDIEVVGSAVYMAGPFTTIGGAARYSLAAVHPVTGLATSWNPNPNGLAVDIEASGSTVYVGGQFTIVGGGFRNRLAAFDATTGSILPWNPDADSDVNALAIHGTTLYAGGLFTTIGGQPRNRIASLYLTSGAVRSWNPGADGNVSVLSADGNSVHAAGSFTLMAGQPSPGFAAFDLSSLIGVEPPRTVGFALNEPRPNPTPRDFAVRFSLPDGAPARLELIDVAGRRINEQDVGSLGAGNHTVPMARGLNLSPGVYLIRLSRGGQSLTTRAVVIQ